MKNDDGLRLRLPKELKRHTEEAAKRHKMKYSEWLRWVLKQAVYGQSERV